MKLKLDTQRLHTEFVMALERHLPVDKFKQHEDRIVAIHKDAKRFVVAVRWFTDGYHFRSDRWYECVDELLKLVDTDPSMRFMREITTLKCHGLELVE